MPDDEGIVVAPFGRRGIKGATQGLVAQRGRIETVNKTVLYAVQAPPPVVDKVSKRILRSRQGLPQLQAVAIAVLDPGELSVALILPLGVDPNTGAGKPREQRF